MANICSNYLKVGPAAAVARPFLEKLSSEGFGGFVPEPPDPGADWRLANWGDDWDIDHDTSGFDFERGKLSFPTAYKPPSVWFQRVAAMHPELTFELHYEESGCGLWGWMQSKDGILTVATEEPLSDECEDWQDEMMNLASDWYDED